MFGGAYFRNFTVFKKKLVRKLQKETTCIASVVSYRLSKKIDREAHSLSPHFILLQFFSVSFVETSSNQTG